jgi:hypothetical protein
MSSFSAMPSRHFRLAMCAMIFSLGAAAPALAEAVSYPLSPSTTAGPTVSNGSIQFDSLGQTSTVAGPAADFIKIPASVGGFLYTGTSRPDDSAILNGEGLVTSLFADLEPADNPKGDTLALYAGDPIYISWNPTLTTRLGAGMYDTAVVPEPSTLSLLFAGFLLISAGLLPKLRPLHKPFS